MSSPYTPVFEYSYLCSYCIEHLSIQARTSAGRLYSPQKPVQIEPQDEKRDRTQDTGRRHREATDVYDIQYATTCVILP